MATAHSQFGEESQETRSEMDNQTSTQTHHVEDVEIQEWFESLDSVLEASGPDVAREILERLRAHATVNGIDLPFTANTPYTNTIPLRLEPLFPGDQELERRIKSLIRWNALAMVVRANREEHNIGGHISTFASAATLYEIGFNHFWRGRSEAFEGDTIYFQGHAAPGMYARAFMEGRLSKEKLENFRRELKPGGGLSSYPHPWLMPDFWEFPTVSMGLSPLMAIYQARFQRYLENRGMKPATDAKVWAFLGDGETDEPESLGAITLASREKLDNLIFVINCNLQRLDGPCAATGRLFRNWNRLSAARNGTLLKCCGAASGIRFWSGIRKGCSSSAWASWWMANTRSWWFRRARMFANIFLDTIRDC